MLKRIKEILLALFCFSLLLSFVIFPARISGGIVNGLLMCSKILIPALFPFSAVALFTAKSGIISGFGNSKLGYYFTIYLLSLIGGYPIGARIIAEEYNAKRISKNSAEKALMFSVNAGPAFVISFVGLSVFGSRKAGFLLLLCEIAASFTMFLVILPKLEEPIKSVEKQDKNLSEIFVNSVSEACTSMLVICGYAVFFSGIITLADSEFLPLKVLVLLCEVTNALTATRNIYAAAFLLGFAGLSIIFQVASISVSFTKSIGKIIIIRAILGALSSVYLLILIKAFRIEISVFSGNYGAIEQAFSGILLSILTVVCSAALIISVQTRKYKGKFIADIL